jgi:serine/threonine-protein kinase HipA
VSDNGSPSPQELVQVEVADVYKAGRLAGQLTRGPAGSPDSVAFAYASSYLADPKTPAVAFSLPKSTDPVTATGGAVPAFFAGLLPEGVRLQAVSRAARTSLDDHLTLLLLVGADAIGDVCVVPSGVTPVDPPILLDPEHVEQVDFGEVFARAVSPEGVDRISLPGVQVKVSSAMVSTPLATTRGPAILKLDPPDIPHLAANEHFFLGMAASCGLAVPAHALVFDRHRKAGLLLERFDRVTTTPEAPARRLAQEDACQVMNRYPAAKYRLRLQDVATTLSQVVHANGGSRPLAVRQILQTAAFSYLIGNGDLHGKNLSVRQDADGLWQVTPAYDLVCTQPYLSWSDPMSLPLFGRANGLSRRWWLDAAERLGLSSRAVSTSLDRIVDGSEEWLDRVHEIGFADATSTRLRQLLTTRRSELMRS